MVKLAEHVLGTSMLVFTVGLIANALSPYARPGSLTVPLLASITNWIAITLFVFAAAPASGGHLNPLITLSTFTAGLSTFPRSILYIVGQCIGAIIGALILKLGLSSEDYYTSVSTYPTYSGSDEDLDAIHLPFL